MVREGPSPSGLGGPRSCRSESRESSDKEAALQAGGTKFQHLKPINSSRSLPFEPGLEPTPRSARARGGGPSMTAPPALLIARSVSSSDVSGGNLPEVAWEHDATSGAGDGLGPGDGYFLNDSSSCFRMCDGMSLSRSSALPAPALVTAQADVTAYPGGPRQLEYQGGGGCGGGNGDLFYDCDDAWMRAEDNTWMHLDDHSAALSHFLDGLPTAPVDASDPPNASTQPGPGSAELVTNAAAPAAETGAYILVDGAATAVDGQHCAATVGGCDWLSDILPESGYGGQPHPPETVLNQEHAVGGLATNDSMDYAHQGNVEPAPGSASAPPVLSAAHGVVEESAFNPVDLQVQPAGGNYDSSASLPADGSAPVFPTGASTSVDVTNGYAVPNPARGVWWTPQPAAPATPAAPAAGAAACAANEAVRVGDGGAMATRKRQREPTKQQPVSPTPHSHDPQQQQQLIPSTGEANRPALAPPTRGRGSSRSSSSSGGGSSSSGGSGSTSRNSRADGALVCALRRCLNAHARKGAEDSASKKAEGAAEVAAEVRCRGAAAGTGPAAASGGQSRTANVPCENVISATSAGRDGAVQRTVLSQSQPSSQPQPLVLPQAQTVQFASAPAVSTVATAAAPIPHRPAAPVRVSPPPAPAIGAAPPTAAPCAAPAAAAPTPTAAPPATCLPPTPAASSAPGGPARAASTAGGGTEGEGVGEAEGEEGSWEDEEQERRRKRLMRNRQSALQSRQRRKSYVSELEGRCAALQATIGQLRQVVAVTAYENGALRDELARLHQMWAAGASTAGAMGVAGVAGVGAAGGTSSEEMRGEEEVEEGKREGGSVSGGGVRADGAEPAVLESDSLPSESLLRHHRHLSQTMAFLLTLFFHWALFLWTGQARRSLWCRSDLLP
ncbi:unnamed protein product [Closterium sp. Yama58-4]|nr:unnamed protein product [Closterium sp. Yama58-4]